MGIVATINDYLWLLVIGMLVLCAVWFTIRLKLVQFRMVKQMVGVMFQKPGKGEIGSFQAFAVALSSRVGTGNLAGVASAIYVGGPGAVLWMWIMALLGAATAFVESTLAQLYKRKGEDSYYGGPAYYMETGLGKRWMGILFAILITLTFALANQVVQSTTLCDSLSDTFVWKKSWVGIVLTIATLIVIFGGIKRISHFASLVVPFMAIGFIILALVIVGMNIMDLPDVLGLIFEDALGIRQIAGGGVGAAVMQGVKRGLFSNEAGEGSAPNAAAIAETSHPVNQGLLQALGVFVDTIVICTCTAFIIIISGKYDCGKDGILLTAEALETEVGAFGRYFITAAIFLFAYSTIIANYFYGETNIHFITRNKWAIFALRVLTGGVVMLGALVDLQTAFIFVDLCMAMMTITNLVAISALFPKVVYLLEDYKSQLRQHKEPEFHRSQMMEEADKLEAWE
ncbi:MAG: alanine:cation symporter family protein [Bacteroidaceae bacterium]|nr:alanine:cation symporter family protein [Bacteroidaceae bacterium]